MTAAVILVGASGRVGRMVRHHWPAAAPALVATARVPADHGLVGWSPLAGPAALADALAARGLRPAALVMLAGVTPHGTGDMDDNVRLATACGAAAGALAIPRVLLASSVAVYGPPQGDRPLSEADPPRPATAYGRAKLAMEAAAPGGCALRIGTVAGADALLGGMDPARPAPRTLDVFADGRTPRRSYIGGGTLARVIATLCAAPDPLPPVLNVAAPGPVEMAALARAAGVPLTLRPAPAEAQATVAMDLGRLLALCPLPPDDSLPATMIAQWRLAAGA
jgi:nucleoside-diphosphate-sugar epimerase